jgi:hypothetical protein
MTGISVLPQELLDIILQLVDIKTLLFAQRVSRHWRHTITSSPKLQEALFLRPKAAPNITSYICDWQGDDLQYFGPFKSYLTPQQPTPSRQTFTPITINPLLANEIYYQSLSHIPQRRGQRFVLPPLGTFLRHPSGSWRSMVLTQPPTPSVVAVSIDTSHRFGLRADINFDEANITLGGLIDKMVAAEGLEAGSYAASLCVWHVMFVDTLETDYLAVGDWIAKYEGGKLVPTPARCSAFSLERLPHPLPPVFSSWPVWDAG